ncbi:MAG: VanZ family protein [Planctomycetes bacterium]|nr:VanZ family protein [Planctomycetota bacterium]
MTPSTRALLRAWGPPVAWCLLIASLSSLPLSTDAELPRGSDKAVHFVEYGVLGFLLARALRPAEAGAPLLRRALLGALLGAAWGGLDEVHQAFVPTRTPEWGDLAADAAGSLAGALLLAAIAGRAGASSAARGPSA